jgi:hypothetical protein
VFFLFVFSNKSGSLLSGIREGNYRFDLNLSGLHILFHHSVYCYTSICTFIILLNSHISLQDCFCPEISSSVFGIFFFCLT